MTTDPIEAYQQEARSYRRRQAWRAAAIIGLAGTACVALATRMSDIGHAAGFACAGGTLLVGAAVVGLLGGASGRTT